jgi:hypothetical protein
MTGTRNQKPATEPDRFSDALSVFLSDLRSSALICG